MKIIVNLTGTARQKKGHAAEVKFTIIFINCQIQIVFGYYFSLSEFFQIFSFSSFAPRLKNAKQSKNLYNGQSNFFRGLTPRQKLTRRSRSINLEQQFIKNNFILQNEIFCNRRDSKPQACNGSRSLLPSRYKKKRREIKFKILFPLYLSLISILSFNEDIMF